MEILPNGLTGKCHTWLSHLSDHLHVTNKVPHIVFPPIRQMLPVQNHHIIYACGVMGFSTQDKARLTHPQHQLAARSQSDFDHFLLTQRYTRLRLSLKITSQPYNTV